MWQEVSGLEYSIVSVRQVVLITPLDDSREVAIVGRSYILPLSFLSFLRALSETAECLHTTRQNYIRGSVLGQARKN